MREFCWKCHLAVQMCYCEHVRPVDLPFEFVILTHPIEFRRRIATGRISHRCLTGSHMFTAENYTEHAGLNALLGSPRYRPYLMHPKPPSLVLNDMSLEAKRHHFAPASAGDGAIPLFIVVDGTWATARKTMRLSKNLHGLPRFCFRPAQASNFRVRRQPDPDYVSTIEAIHESIEQLLAIVPAEIATERPHDRLLDVFNVFVEKQAAFVDEARRSGQPSRYKLARRDAPEVRKTAMGDGSPTVI